MLQNRNWNNLYWIYALSALTYFTQGISSLPGQALFYYMKETLGFDASKIMYLSVITGIAWLVKPLIGFVIDSMGWRKKMWLLVMLLSDVAISIYLGLSQYLPISFIILLIMFGNWNTSTRDVAVDGIMVVEGKKRGITGKIQSVQWIAITIASIITGIGGGYIAEKFNYQLAYLLMLPVLIAVAFSAIRYKEEKTKVVKRHFIQDMGKLFSSKKLILACLFIFLFNFSPSFGTPLTFIERDVFHWSKMWIGALGTLCSILSIIGAILYFKFSTKINLRKWLYSAVLLGAVTTLCYLYFTPTSAIVYGLLFSVLGMFIQLVMLDFMARSALKGLETTSFALLCSVNNLAGTANSLSGAFLLPIVGLQTLIVISALTTFVCLPLIGKLGLEEPKSK